MSKVMPIALVTFSESLRSKILYSVLFAAAFVVFLSAMFGRVTIGDQVKVIKDFGLFSISLFSVGYAVITGSTLLAKELARKTIYNLLSRPVHRWQFVVGKFIGMYLMAATLLSLMALGFSFFLFLFEERVDWLLFEGYYFMLLELGIVCAAAIFFSSIVVTPSLSGLFSFSLFLAGRSSEYLLFFVKQSAVTGTLSTLLQTLYKILPHLDQLNAANFIVYGIGLTPSYAIWATAYAFGYSTVLLALASLIFRGREFN